MDVLLANEITPAMLVSTNAPERLDGQTEWVASTAYAAGATVTRTSTRRVYRAATAVPNTIGPPETDIATNPIPYWVNVGPMNQWAMFDGQVKTQTVGPADGNLVVVIRPGPVTAVWLSNIDYATAAQVDVLDKPGGDLVYSERRGLSRPVASWWDWWFAPFSLTRDAPFIGIPAYRQCEITITLEAGGTSIGMTAVGGNENLGQTEWGVDARFNNYSARDLNSTWGPTQATEGEVTKDITYRVYVNPEDAPRVDRFLKVAMRRPAVFVPTGNPEFEGIRIFGQAINANLGYPGPNYVPLDLTIREFI